MIGGRRRGGQFRSKNVRAELYNSTRIQILMIIVNGRAIAQKVLAQIKTDFSGRSISIAAIWVGDNLAINRFVEIKKKYAESIGIKVTVFHFNSNEPEDKIVNKIKELSEDNI